MPNLVRIAVIKAEEPKVASRAARLLLEELLRELELCGLNPADYVGEVAVTLKRKAKK